MRCLEVYGSSALYRRLGSLGLIAILAVVISFLKFGRYGLCFRGVGGCLLS